MYSYTNEQYQTVKKKKENKTKNISVFYFENKQTNKQNIYKFKAKKQKKME